MIRATGQDELTGLAGWVVEVMETLGGPGAALLIAAENLFPPLPSEVILPMAGFTASRGELGLIEVLVWTTLGSIVGASLLYALGAVLGEARFRRVAARVPLVQVGDVDRTIAWFDRHGAKAVFFGRMLPIFRSLISIPAGITRMPFGLFLALTTAGSAVWNTIFVVGGYQLGEQWHRIAAVAETLQIVVIATVVIAVALWIVLRVRAGRRTDESDDLEP